MRSCFFENSRSRNTRCRFPHAFLSEGENTQDKDVKGEISAGAAAPDECAEETLFSLFYWENDVNEGSKQEIVDKKTMGPSYLLR